MNSATPPAYMKRSQYAAHIGRSPGYITQLAAQGRVVFTPDGRFVDVAKTDALLAATADPAKQPVADRHAAARGDAPPAQPEAEDPPGHLYDFQGSKAKREHYAAEREHTAFLKEAGELMERGRVEATFANAGAIIRAKLEALPALMPPLLHGQSESIIQSTLADQVERVLKDMADTFAKLSKEARQE